MNRIRRIGNQSSNLRFKIIYSKGDAIELLADAENVDFYLLDLLSFRNISNEIADQFNVHHQSPQILLIHKGECIFDESHNAIAMDEVAEQVALLA